MNDIYDGVYKAAVNAGFQDQVAKDLASKAVRSERLKILGEIQKGLETFKVIKAGKPVGSISERKDGKYKKVGDGEWKPLDHGELNIPGRTKNIDQQLDKYKSEQEKKKKEEEKTKREDTAKNKDTAKRFYEKHGDELVDTYSKKLGKKPKEIRDLFDQWVKWEPEKMILVMNKLGMSVDG